MYIFCASIQIKTLLGVQVDTAMGEEDEFFMHQSSSGDLFDLLEMPVKLKRLEP